MENVVFQNLIQELSHVSKALATSSVSNTLEPFGGDSKFFKLWLQNIDKQAFVLGCTEETKVTIAFQSSRGMVSEFIGRHLRANPNCAWPDLKEELKKQYGDVIDRQHAMTVLRSARQTKESVQVFAQRLLGLAEDAFLGELENPVAQQQLTTIFVDGLTSTELKTKMIRENHPNFEAAVQAAVKEQHTRQRVQARLGKATPSTYLTRNEEEPMEVDQSRRMKCFHCEGPHKARFCPRRDAIRRVQEINKQAEAEQPRRHPNEQRPRNDTPWANQRRTIECWTCGGPHLRRNCPKNGVGPRRGAGNEQPRSQQAPRHHNGRRL